MNQPKTTWAGIVAGILVAIPGFDQLISEGFTSGNWKVVGAKILAGLVVGLLGYFAHDSKPQG